VSGDWVVTIDDQAGHKGRVTVAVSESFFSADDPAGDVQTGELHHAQIHGHEHGHGLSVLYRVVIGLSLIFGITGIVYGIRARREV
jgi:hypothetical protein